MNETRNLVYIFTIIGLFGLISCGPASDPEVTEKAEIPWGYVGETGPDNWGELTEEFSLCSTGKEQSPINITNPSSVDLENLDFQYKATSLELLHNGHTVQVNHASNSFVNIEGVSYELIQFHFHAPSEHTIDGRSFPVEMHLVHANEAGELAVVGVMIEEGAENSALSAVWQHLPEEAGNEKSVADAMIDAAELLPTNRETFRYDGSLTTPPCSEDVKWNVFTTPLTMDAAQIAVFEEVVVHENNRPVQSLNARLIQADASAN